jgi:hypothetical protein
MSLFRRNDSPNWYTLVRWKGYPTLSLSTGTPNKGRAVAIERTLFALRGNGRRDILELLALKRLRLPDVHESHTFAVHWVMAGLPLARLQRILGHRTPAMTMRYARHSPEAYFAEDAARLSASLSGGSDPETEALRRAVIQRADSA